MKTPVFLVVLHLVLFLIGWGTGFFAFSVFSAIVFAWQVVRTEKLKPTIFYANFFVNVNLIIFVISCLLIDIFPRVYLLEISRFTSYESITSFYLVIVSPVFSMVNHRVGLPHIPISLTRFKSDSFRLVSAVAWVMFSILVFLIFQLYSKTGFPIASGLHRIFFYQQLDAYEIYLFVLLSFFSALFGYLHAHCHSRLNFLALAVILFMRVLAMQKFTELLLDFSLFFMFAKSNHAGMAAADLSSRTQFLLYKSIVLAVSFFLVLSLTLYSFNNETDIFAERLMAQAQLAFAYVQDGINIIPNLRYLFNEFANFTGSQDLRLDLFSKGEYYGVFTLMNAANTGRDLFVQAEEMTSSSGSFPAIYFYLFGAPLGFVVALVTTYFLVAINNAILYFAHETRNPLFVVFGFLVIIRTLKFFVVGSPSHVFNIQYFIYLALVAALLILHFRPVCRPRIQV